MFDHVRMAATPLPTRATALEELRAKVQDLQGGLPRQPLPMPGSLRPLIQLRTGGAYRVDDAGLALTLLAAPSRAGGWTAIVGVDDLGIEAALESGLDLDRTVLVPNPGEDWLEATAALVDVVPVVLLRPPHAVAAGTATRLGARLRKRAATLFVQGNWPGAEATLGVSEQRWYGAGAGHGRLTSRRVIVSCERGSAPPVTTELWLPGDAVEPEREQTHSRIEVAG